MNKVKQLQQALKKFDSCDYDTGGYNNSLEMEFNRAADKLPDYQKKTTWIIYGCIGIYALCLWGISTFHHVDYMVFVFLMGIICITGTVVHSFMRHVEAYLSRKRIAKLLIEEKETFKNNITDSNYKQVYQLTVKRINEHITFLNELANTE